MSSKRRGSATAPVQMRIADRLGHRFVPLLATLGLAFASLVTVLAAGASLAADEADAPLQEVTWFHSTPGDVRSFVLVVAPQEGAVASARQIDVGKPISGAGGQFFSAVVAMDAGEFIAVSAVGKNGIQSALSDWGQPQPSKPGQPLVVDP
jgi:hypothetical protein